MQREFDGLSNFSLTLILSLVSDKLTSRLADDPAASSKYAHDLELLHVGLLREMRIRDLVIPVESYIVESDASMRTLVADELGEL